MNIIGKTIDRYLDYPLIIDVFLIIITLIANEYLPSCYTIKYNVNSQANLLSSLIGTSVSLAGFILAALTIIVTFKSNIANKVVEQAKNPLELIFSSDNYYNIIRVFKQSIIELTLTFAFLYIVWIFKESINAKWLLYSNVYGTMLIFLSLGRTLFILFIVLNLDKAEEVPMPPPQ